MESALIRKIKKQRLFVRVGTCMKIQKQQHNVRFSTTFMYAVSSLLEIKLSTTMSSANLIMELELCVAAAMGSVSNFVELQGWVWECSKHHYQLLPPVIYL